MIAIVFSIVIAVAGAAISAHEARKMMKKMGQKPPDVDSVTVPLAEDGREIPVVFGTVWLEGPNVCQYSTPTFTAIKKKSGGKK